MDFEAVYRENFAHVYRFLLSLCRDAHLAEELTQDTFDRAFRKGEQFNGRCELKTWLCSIARNAYLSECRRARRPAPPAEAALDVDPDDRDGVLRIHRALHDLAEPYKEAFTLRTLGELRYSEIGALFGRSENWARVTYYRAKVRLRDRVGKERDHDGED